MVVGEVGPVRSPERLFRVMARAKLSIFPLQCTLTLTLPLSLSLSHTYTHTHTHTQNYTHTEVQVVVYIISQHDLGPGKQARARGYIPENLEFRIV